MFFTPFLVPEFEEKYGNVFYKILTEDLTHHCLTYKIGVNIDPIIPFNPSGSCEAGGLKFTTEEHVFKFIKFGTKIAQIKLCEDSKVYIEPNKKSSKQINLRSFGLNISKITLRKIQKKWS